MIKINAPKQAIALFERAAGCESAIVMLATQLEKARKEAWSIVKKECDIPKGTKIRYNGHDQTIEEIPEDSAE